MMVQSHDNDRFYILLCDFQLRTKKIYYHIHIAHFITRDLAHHKLTQDSIDSRIFYCIAISKSRYIKFTIEYSIIQVHKQVNNPILNIINDSLEYRWRYHLVDTSYMGFA